MERIAKGRQRNQGWKSNVRGSQCAFYDHDQPIGFDSTPIEKHNKILVIRNEKRNTTNEPQQDETNQKKKRQDFDFSQHLQNCRSKVLIPNSGSVAASGFTIAFAAVAQVAAEPESGKHVRQLRQFEHKFSIFDQEPFS